MTLSELVARAEGDNQRLVRAADQPTRTDPDTGYRRLCVSPPTGRSLELVETGSTSMRARSTFDEIPPVGAAQRSVASGALNLGPRLQLAAHRRLRTDTHPYDGS